MNVIQITGLCCSYSESLCLLGATSNRNPWLWFFLGSSSGQSRVLCCCVRIARIAVRQPPANPQMQLTGPLARRSRAAYF